MKRRIFSLFLVVLLLLPMVLTGCGEEQPKQTKPYTAKFDTSRLTEGKDGSAADEDGNFLIDENDSFALYWNDGRQCALLHDKTNDKWYGTTPYEYFKDESQLDNIPANYELYNPVRIKYIDINPSTNASSIQPPTEGTYESSLERSVENDAASSTLLFNKEGGIVGVRLTYNFPDLEISVAIDLRLNKNGLEVRIPMNCIRENSKKLYEIALMPYFVSAANDGGGYVMVPSGSGALVSAKTLSEVQRFSEPVYGEDQIERVTLLKTAKNQVHLPVFGSSDNGKGMLGIIGNGAACARINVTAGDKTVGYTAAYASFRIRGNEKVVLTAQENGANSSADTYTDSVAGYEYLSVQYQPLQGDASYVDMANTYRNYLMDKGYLKKRPTDAPALSVNFLGATQITESFFGIPYQSDVATTTLAQTQTISAELKKLIGDKQMLVTLSGYGEGGLANTTIGGGFDLSGTVGGSDEWESLVAFAKKNNTVLALDYNLTHFQEGSSGFSTNSSAAYTNSQLKFQLYTYKLNTGLEDKDGLAWYLLAREKLSAAADEAIAAAKELQLGAVSYGSLSNFAYSDYRAVRNTAKGQMDKDVAAEFEKTAKAGFKLVSNKANQYAALQADYITEIPTHSSQYNLFSQEIPFYALVFQGYKVLTSASINTAVNVRSAFLDAVATGTTLQFTLFDSHHDSLQFEQDTAYISGRYADWKGDIESMVKESADLYDKVGGQAITAYEKVDGVSMTTFENGVVVYVNYTDAAVETPKGTVESMDFIYG